MTHIVKLFGLNKLQNLINRPTVPAKSGGVSQTLTPTLNPSRIVSVSHSPEVFVRGEQTRGARPNDVVVAAESAAIAPRLRENVPESKSFIAGAGDNGGAVGAHGQVEHSEGVPCQRRDLLHRRILPHYDLVQTVAVRTDQLIVGLGEDKVADLTASVDSADRLER